MVANFEMVLWVLQAVQMSVEDGLQFYCEKHALECSQKPPTATSSQPAPDDQALNEDEGEGSSAPALPYESMIVLDTDNDDGYVDSIDLMTGDDDTNDNET